MTGLSQSVKAVCTLLANIQTIEVARSLKRVEDIVEQMLEVSQFYLYKEWIEF